MSQKDFFLSLTIGCYPRDSDPASHSSQPTWCSRYHAMISKCPQLPKNPFPYGGKPSLLAGEVRQWGYSQLSVGGCGEMVWIQKCMHTVHMGPLYRVVLRKNIHGKWSLSVLNSSGWITMKFLWGRGCYCWLHGEEGLLQRGSVRYPVSCSGSLCLRSSCHILRTSSHAFFLNSTSLWVTF